MTLSIRPIVATDRAIWQPLFEAYLAFYETTRPAEVLDAVFARMVSGHTHEFRGLLAQRDGETVGFTHFLRHRKMWDIEDAVYLMDLYVRKNQRCSGVARALIKGVYSLAKAENTPNVYWLTQQNNHTAKALYDKVATRTDFIQYAHRVD